MINPMKFLTPFLTKTQPGADIVVDDVGEKLSEEVEKFFKQVIAGEELNYDDIILSIRKSPSTWIVLDKYASATQINNVTDALLKNDTKYFSCPRHNFEKPELYHTFLSSLHDDFTHSYVEFLLSNENIPFDALQTLVSEKNVKEITVLPTVNPNWVNSLQIFCAGNNIKLTLVLSGSSDFETLITEDNIDNFSLKFAGTGVYEETIARTHNSVLLKKLLIIKNHHDLEFLHKLMYKNNREHFANVLYELFTRDTDKFSGEILRDEALLRIVLEYGSETFVLRLLNRAVEIDAKPGYPGVEKSPESLCNLFLEHTLGLRDFIVGLAADCRKRFMLRECYALEKKYALSPTRLVIYKREPALSEKIFEAEELTMMSSAWGWDNETVEEYAKYM